MDPDEYYKHSGYALRRVLPRFLWNVCNIPGTPRVGQLPALGETNFGTIRHRFYHAPASRTAARLKAISGSSGESEAAILENNNQWSNMVVVMGYML